MFDLVVEKLTEILHIQLAFRRIRNCGKAVQFHPGFSLNSLNSADDIRQFAHAGWFNNNPIRLKLFSAFFQGFRKFILLSLCFYPQILISDSAGVFLFQIPLRPGLCSLF